MIIAFYTLGCKVNQYETQAMREIFLARGYDLAEEEAFADVYVINTCTVTGLSDKKSRQYIRRVKRINPHAITAVIGCYVQISAEEVAKIDGVDIVAGTNEKTRLPDYIEEFIQNHQKLSRVKAYSELTDYEETGTITSMEGRTRAFIKIQEGCNKFCSYCIIPFARGPVRSRAMSSIISEAENLILKGFKELVLTGINTALYHDDSSNTGLSGMISVISRIPGDYRIRLGSLEPTVIDVDYAKELTQYDRLCHHMHLSVQSGSDDVLAGMNRNYRIGDYKKILEALRAHDTGYGITTDLIVGFPGETEACFEDTIRLVDQFDFCRVHVFKYSKRKGTAAADMPGHLDPETKYRRSQRLIKSAEKSMQRFLAFNSGSSRMALIEGYDAQNKCYQGLTDNYIKVYINHASNEMEAQLINTFQQVKLSYVYLDGMVASFMKNEVKI